MQSIFISVLVTLYCIVKLSASVKKSDNDALFSLYSNGTSWSFGPSIRSCVKDTSLKSDNGFHRLWFGFWLILDIDASLTQVGIQT